MKIVNNILYSEKLSKFKEIRHGTSTKAAGHLSFKKEPDSNRVIIDRTKFADKIDIEANESVVMGEQYHTGNARLVTVADGAKGMFEQHTMVPETDGMVTNERNLNLVVYTADCLPVLFYDPIQEVVGVAHAGWRGLIEDIIPHTIAIMTDDFNSKPKDIISYIGPSLGPRHFEVHKDVADKFSTKFPNGSIVRKLDKTDEGGDKFLVDLWQAVIIQLMKAGLKKNNIENSGICTWEHNDLFSSARLEGKSRKDTNWSVIGIG